MNPLKSFCVKRLLASAVALAALSQVSFLVAAEEQPVSAAVFSCDVTPPLGHPLCGGWIKPLEKVDDPLLAKGIILAQGKTRYVICAVDWCLLQTGAYDLFAGKMAAAARIPVSQVSVHTVHQHNAPVADVNAQLLLNGLSNSPPHLDLKFMAEVTDRVAAAVRSAEAQLRPVTHVGYGSNRVERFAANRRVRLPDGKIYPRYSSSKDPVMQAAPEGLIDPWLRTVTLFNGDQPLVRLHYYACHPQSYYGDGRATSDTAGLARERIEREEGVPQLYFTGCAGNITAGKYNNGSPAARSELVDRICAGMRGAIANTCRAPVKALKWNIARVRFAPRTETVWQEDSLRPVLNNPNGKAAERLQAALNLAWLKRLKDRPQVDVNCVTLGPVELLHLPGEAFIEYQLYAESLRPHGFVAVAAYGESGTGYICTDAALTEGGYEPTESRVGPPSEFRLKEAIAKLLPRKEDLADPPWYEDKQHLLVYRDNRGRERPIRKASDWARRREQILASMQVVMGALPDPRRQPPLDLRVVEETRMGTYKRQKITFLAETGDRIPAWLLIPNDLHGKAPAMLCLHQTTPAGKDEPAGLSGNKDMHYAEELAGRGYVVLAPDYPNFGEYKVDVYAQGYASATLKGILNHRRAVDVLESLPQVDRNHIGAIGHSLGGHNALFAAAFDARIKAVITSCGFNSFFSYAGGDLAGWSHKGYMPRIAARFGNDPKLMPFDFTEVLATLAPRPVFVSAPMGDTNFPVSGVKDCVLAASPVYELLHAGDELTAIYPDCEHEFPGAMREAAYEWLDKQFRAPGPLSAR